MSGEIMSSKLTFKYVTLYNRIMQILVNYLLLDFKLGSTFLFLPDCTVL